MFCLPGEKGLGHIRSFFTFPGRGSDRVSLARLFKSLSLPKLLREIRVSNPSPRMWAVACFAG